MLTSIWNLMDQSRVSLYLKKHWGTMRYFVSTFFRFINIGRVGTYALECSRICANYKNHKHQNCIITLVNFPWTSILYTNTSFFLQLKYNGKSISLPFNLAIFKWATGTRQVISNAKLPDGVCFYNIYGTSFDTPFDVWYVSKMLLEKQVCLCINIGWEMGSLGKTGSRHNTAIGIFFHLTTLIKILLCL